MVRHCFESLVDFRYLVELFTVNRVWKNNVEKVDFIILIWYKIMKKNVPIPKSLKTFEGTMNFKKWAFLLLSFYCKA